METNIQIHSLAELGITKKPKVLKGEITKTPFRYLLYYYIYIFYIIIYNNNNNTSNTFSSTFSIGNSNFMTLLNRNGVYIL